MKKNNKGFTLLELLVVIGIITTLSSLVVIRMNEAANNTMDVKRKADIQLLTNAIISYSSEHYNSKPISTGCTIGAGGDCSAEINESLAPYLSSMPTDPESGTYYIYESNGSDCAISAVLSNGETYEYSCTDNQISVNAPIEGACGLANGQSSYTIPTTNLCEDSSTPTVSGTGPWTWKCLGSYLGADADCSSKLSIDGVCGSADGTNSYVKPATNLCADGFLPIVSGTSLWTWSCPGSNNGQSDSCLAYAKIDGVCGSSHGHGFYSIPTTNLCVDGSTPTVSGTGPWSWTCLGQNSGDSASCSASKNVDAVCGISAGQSSYTVPTTNLCVDGSTPVVSGSGPWSWTCLGQNEGASAFCTSQLTVGGTFVYYSSTSVTVPNGVTSVSAVLIGGGGGGGGGGTAGRGGTSYPWNNTTGAGGGGGGSGYVNTGSITVSGGGTLTITVGAGGGAGTGYSETGGTGGASTISFGSQSLSASGGAGGGGGAGSACCSCNATGGAGGAGYTNGTAGGDGYGSGYTGPGGAGGTGGLGYIYNSTRYGNAGNGGTGVVGSTCSCGVCCCCGCANVSTSGTAGSSGLVEITYH